LPPDGAAVQVADSPIRIDVGETEHEPMSAGVGVTVSELLQGTVTVWDPELMTTVAVFVPGIAYVPTTDCEVPVRPSVPLHE
jgi:hypothetical protein